MLWMRMMWKGLPRQWRPLTKSDSSTTGRPSCFSDSSAPLLLKTNHLLKKGEIQKSKYMYNYLKSYAIAN